MRSLLFLLAFLLTVCTEAWAAFPTVEATSTSVETANTASHTVNTCAGGTSGELLLIIFGQDSAAGATAASWPGGWTSLVAWTNRADGLYALEARYRISDGSEAATITVTTSASETSSHICYRIKPWHGTTAPEGPASFTADGGGDANPNPPSFNPTNWDIEDTLWIVVAGVDGDKTYTADPTNYTNSLEAVGAESTGGVRVRSLRRELAAASEDPDTFTISAADNWLTTTIAVRPSAITAVPSVTRRRSQ